MKRLVQLVVCLTAAAPWLYGQSAGYQVTRTLASPDHSIVASVGARTSNYGPIYFLGTAKDGSFQPFTDLPNPVYRREYHGSDWFQTAPEHWIDGRFLVFEDQYGIAIADVRNQQMLVDHVFTAYAKSPAADEWAAIRFRPTTRMQEQLVDDFQDTLLLIDPEEAATHIREISDSNFVGQMKAVQPGGVMLAKPEWASDGSSVAVLAWNQSTVTAVRYDTNLHETGRTPVNIPVDRDTARSLAFKPELVQTAKHILSDPTTFSSSSASVSEQTSPVTSLTPATSASISEGEQQLAKPLTPFFRRPIALAIAAAFVLLVLLFLFRRKRS